MGVNPTTHLQVKTNKKIVTTTTRTFPILLSPTTTNAVIELVHFRDVPLVADESAAVYLEAAFCNVSLKSFQLMKFPNYEGDESEAERLALFTAAELSSQKIGLRLLGRKNNTGAWREKAEIILTNAGRKSYFDLLIPYLAKAQVRLLEYNDALGVQLIDYGNGLLKLTDFIEIEFACTVDIQKKNNNFEQLSARIASLELALEGKLTGLSANSLLGRIGTAGTVQTIPLPLPVTLGGLGSVNTGVYGSIAIPATAKAGWSGMQFDGAGGWNYLMQDPNTGNIGIYNAGGPLGVFWRWFSTTTEFNISQPLRISTGTPIKKVLSQIVSVDLPNIIAGGGHVFNVAVAGATIGSFCQICLLNTDPFSGLWTLYFHAVVVASGDVRVTCKNDWTGPLDFGLLQFRILVIEF
jgi:hypothetical protein